MKNFFLRHIALAVSCSILLCAAAPAQASLTDAERKDLAKSFVGRLKSLYSGEKIPAAVPAVDEDLGMTGSEGALNFIPDGQELLLQPELGRDFTFADNVPAVKQNGRIYLGFADFIDILYFPIQYDPDTESAAGWFLREDWDFSMDYNARSVVSRGQSLPIAEEDVYMYDDELYVTAEALAAWFGIGITPNLMRQTLELKSDYPFPALAQQYRADRAQRQTDYLNQPVNPLIETDYKWLDINSAQVSLSNNLRRRPDQESQRSHSATVIGQGQLLKHNFYSSVNSNNREGLNAVTARLYREEHEPVLLGPLKARAYYLGDVEQTDIPLTPASGQELGFNVTNNPLDRIDFTKTSISGNAIPGWDVELYRNGALLSLVTVDEGGRYDFTDVDLFAGENDFELLFFGPQGEVRKEIVEIPVSTEILAQQNNVYEFAATLSDEQTYRKIRSGDTDEGAPHIAGRYNFFTGDMLNYVAFRTQQVEDERKAYVVGGFTTTWLKSLIDGSLAMDEGGGLRAGLQARRRFEDTDISAAVEAGTERYNTTGTSDPNVLDVDLGFEQKLHFLPGRKNNLLADFNYQQSASGLASQNHTVRLASQYGPFNLSNAYNYRTSESTTGEDNKESNLVTSLRSRLGSNKLFWRAQSTYGIEPEKEMENLLLELKYKHNKEWSGDFSVEHRPPESFTEYRVGANWNHENFLLTPFVEYDTNRELFTGVNLRFAMVDTEESFWPEMTSRNVIGQGAVAAFVFLDKNGDLVFNGADEKLEGVKVKSVNIARYAETNEDGIATIQQLPANHRTDIAMDSETFPEAFMISKYEGRSVSPKPGETVKVSMPVQLAGEIDGTVYLRRDTGTSAPLNRIAVRLLPLEDDLNEAMDSQSLYEGLFVFSLIPPGRYYLVADEAFAAQEEAGRPMPRLIDIGYDGPVIYAQDIILVEGAKDVGFDVMSEEESYKLGLAPVADRRAALPYFFLSLGKKDSSRLLSTLYNFGARKRAGRHVADFKSIETRDAKTGESIVRYFAPGNSLEEAYARCARISAEGMACRVEAALPPSEGFALRAQGLITADRASDPEKLASNL